MRYCLCNHAERVHRDDVGCTRCACMVFEFDPLYEPGEADHLFTLMTPEEFATWCRWYYSHAYNPGHLARQQKATP